MLEIVSVTTAHHLSSRIAFMSLCYSDHARTDGGEVGHEEKLFDTNKQMEPREMTGILAKGPKDIHVRR